MGNVPIAPYIDNIPLLPRLWRWKPHFFELGLYIGFYLIYRFTRGLIFPDESVGVGNAQRVIAAERSLGFFWEPGWQNWAIDNSIGLVVFLNWVYIITYWPIILAMALALYLNKRGTYYYYRNVLVINLLFALIIFMLFPLAPPFKESVYFVDTIQTYGPSFYGSPQMAAYYNTLAAMPSLHFSWTVILGVLFFRTLKGWFKAVGVLYPVLTFLAITITGNHYILDAVAGGGLAAVSFGLVELAIRRRRSRQAIGSRLGRPTRH